MEVNLNKGDASMGRRIQKINVVIHEPEDTQVCKNVQQAVDDLYIKMIVDKLSSSGLTYDEQKEALKRLIPKG